MGVVIGAYLIYNALYMGWFLTYPLHYLGG